MKTLRLAVLGIGAVTLAACAASTSAEETGTSDSVLESLPFVSEPTADGSRLRVRKVTLPEGSVPVGFFDTQLSEPCSPRETMLGLRCVPDRAQPVAAERNYMSDFAFMDSYFTDESCTQAAIELPQAVSAASCTGGAKLVTRMNHADTYCRSGSDEIALDVYRVDSERPVPAQTKIYMRAVFGGCAAISGTPPRLFPATKLTKDLVSFTAETVDGRGRLRPERLVGSDQSAMWSQRTLHDREFDVPCETAFDATGTSTTAVCKPLDSVTAPAPYTFGLDSTCSKMVRGAYDNCGHQPKVAFAGGYFLTQPIAEKTYELIGGTGAKECREASRWNGTTDFYPLGNEKPLASTSRKTIGRGRIRERVLFDSDGQPLSHVAFSDQLLGAEVAPERIADGSMRFVPNDIAEYSVIGFEDEAMQKPVIFGGRAFGNVMLARGASDGCGRAGAIYTETGDPVEFDKVYIRPRGEDPTLVTQVHVKAKRATLVDPQFFAVAELVGEPTAIGGEGKGGAATPTPGATQTVPTVVTSAAPSVAGDSGGCQTSRSASFGGAWMGVVTALSTVLARRKRTARR